MMDKNFPKFVRYFYSLIKTSRCIRNHSSGWPYWFDVNDEDKKLFPELTRYDAFVMDCDEKTGEIFLFDYLK